MIKRTQTSQKQWTDQWDVVGRSGDEHVVSKKYDGTYACSCGKWKFHPAPKVNCHHINAVLNAENIQIVSFPLETAKKKRPVEEFAEKFFGRDRGGLYTLNSVCDFAEAFAKESGGRIDTPEPEVETVNTGEFTITRKFRLVS